MSRPRLAVLLVFVAGVGMFAPSVAIGETSSRYHHPPLLDCGPAPVLSTNHDATFRANLASALATLPSSAAAERGAFATVQFGTARPGSAFARSACFGANVSSSPAMARACESCLSAAARDVTGGCRASGRAGVWRNECFLSYAESSDSSNRKDAFRGWFYSGPSTNATLAGGECVTDRAVDCGRCLHDSARAAKALGWWQRIHGEEVLVVSYSCFLRVRISSLPWSPDEADASAGSVILITWLNIVFGVATETLGILFYKVIKMVRALPQVNNG